MPDTTIPASTRGRVVRTRLGLESAIGTIATAWTPMRFYTTTDGMQRDLVRDDQLGVALANNRDLGKRRQGLPTGTIQRTVPLNLNELPLWLSLGFARVTTGSSPNYIHTFASGSTPSNSATLVNNYDSGDWGWDLGVVMGGIRVQGQKDATTARAQLTLLALKDAVGSSAPSGSVASAFAADDLSDWTWKVSWDGTVIGDAIGVDINIDLGVERIQGLSGDVWPTMHHFGDVVATGNFTLYGNGKTFRDLGRAGTTKTLVLIATDPANANRYVSFSFANTQLNVPQRAVGGPGQVSAQLSFEAAQDGSTAAVTIAVGNAVASY